MLVKSNCILKYIKYFSDDIMKNYIRAQKIKRETQKGSTPEPIIISVRFSAYNPDGTVEMDLFMSSDDVNAIYFFKEFEKIYFQIRRKR